MAVLSKDESWIFIAILTRPLSPHESPKEFSANQYAVFPVVFHPITLTAW